MSRRFLVLALAALSVAVVRSHSVRAAAEGTPVVISADRPCSVKVDGDDVAILADDAPKKIRLAPGEHLFTAVSIDKADWKQVIVVGTAQKVVSIEFPKKVDHPAAAAAAPATTWTPAMAAAAGALLKGTAAARTGINEIKRENGRWTIKSIESESPADKSGLMKGDVLVSVDGESVDEKSYEQLQALDRGASGSNVVLQYMDRKGRPQKVTLSRQLLSADVKPVVPWTPTTGVKPVYPWSTPTPAGSGGTCVGWATPCNLRNASNCRSGSGCFFVLGKCGGSASSCGGLASYTCNSQPGCTYLPH
jgi:hypothetical protein